MFVNDKDIIVSMLNLMLVALGLSITYSFIFDYYTIEGVETSSLTKDRAENVWMHTHIYITLLQNPFLETAKNNL